jgi:inhibitor of cysteine peptidase
MSRIVIVAAGLFVVLALGACLPGPGGGAKQITKADVGKTIEVAKGSNLEVALDGNPTTGFTWSVKTVDANILKQAGEPTFKADSGAMGAGGKQTFVFNTVNAGQTALLMEYSRSWETGVPAAETFMVTVVVK